MDPSRITAIDAARPLTTESEYTSSYVIRNEEYLVMISWNSDIARSEPATPRTAEETI